MVSTLQCQTIKAPVFACCPDLSLAKKLNHPIIQTRHKLSLPFLSHTYRIVDSNPPSSLCMAIGAAKLHSQQAEVKKMVNNPILHADNELECPSASEHVPNEFRGVLATKKAQKGQAQSL